MRKQAVLRIRIITAIVLSLAVILMVRLYQLQIARHDYYIARAEEQYVHTVRDLYNRGTIYFTTKTGELVSAATIKGGFVLAVDPTRMTDPQATYTALAPYLSLSKDRFIERATLPERTYVEIETTLDDDVAEAIEALDLSGVQLYRNQWRYYPGDSLSARTVGFTGYGSDNNLIPTGRYGLERYYEDVLERDQDRLSVDFFAELFSSLGSMVSDQPEAAEGDIVTTIEPTVARMLQEELKATQERWHSKVTGGIIMNAQTGEIYALDAVPTYDLNDRSGATIEDFRNPLVENVYEMGSIVKALTMASGIDAGAVTPTTTYFDPGCLEIDTYRICNYDLRGRGTVPMQEVLNQSLNTGVSFVVDQMGKDAFRAYFTNLKLGSETGIDLPNEAHGLIDNLNSPRDVEYATASFGQGIAVTPIEMTRALAALGNGGVLVTPHLVSKVQYEDGTSKELQYPTGSRVFKKETSETISRMLTTVVDDALHGGDVAFQHYSVAAKTGTAQIADTVHGGYYADRYLHSFFDYFPSYDPQFIIFLYTVEPKNVRYASETLTDPVFNLTEFLINYYDVPPDR